MLMVRTAYPTVTSYYCDWVLLQRSDEIMNKKFKISLGFTLIEVMVVVAIMGVLLRFAVPSINSMVLSSRATTAANAMATALQRARSEAVKQVKSAGVTTTTSGSSLWGNGWVVWVGTTATIVQNYGSITSDITVTQTGFSSPAAPTYLSDGRISGIAGTFKFAFSCPNPPASQTQCSRTATVGNTGRVRVTNP